jgi:hypothetical protein
MVATWNNALNRLKCTHVLTPVDLSKALSAASTPHTQLRCYAGWQLLVAGVDWDSKQYPAQTAGGPA